jgi:hypothetical protein
MRFRLLLPSGHDSSGVTVVSTKGVYTVSAVDLQHSCAWWFCNSKIKNKWKGIAMQQNCGFLLL